MDAAYLDHMKRRREAIVAKMAVALERSGRTFADVDLVAVSKTVGVEEVEAAIAAGFHRFGENRPQELVRKIDAISQFQDAPRVSFDMIGNLQTNKINAVLGRASLIHSISSLHLAQAVSTRVERRMAQGQVDAPQDVLIEVNVSGEESKSGFDPEALRRELPELRALCGIHIAGLMTMAPCGDKQRARACFAGLRKLRDELASLDASLDLRELSCGMSEDFEVALEEGSTIVRLGRVLFDPGFAVK